MIYTNENFRMLNSHELSLLFLEAKTVSTMVYGIKLIKKVQKDILNMRVLLNGFDAVHNEEQNVR